MIILMYQNVEPKHNFLLLVICNSSLFTLHLELALRLIFSNSESMLINHIALSALYLMLQTTFLYISSLNTHLISVLYELQVINFAFLLVIDALTI